MWALCVDPVLVVIQVMVSLVPTLMVAHLLLASLECHVMIISHHLTVLDVVSVLMDLLVME